MLSTDTKLNELVNRLKEVSAANLQSVILYGSAARGGYHPDHSDLNVFCVARLADRGRVGPYGPSGALVGGGTKRAGAAIFYRRKNCSNPRMFFPSSCAICRTAAAYCSAAIQSPP